MTAYDIRIEPLDDMTFEQVASIIANAFMQRGGLSEEGVECLNID